MMKLIKAKLVQSMVDISIRTGDTYSVATSFGEDDKNVTHYLVAIPASRLHELMPGHHTAQIKAIEVKSSDFE